MREIKFRAWSYKENKMYYNIESMYEDDPAGIFGNTKKLRFLCFAEALDEYSKNIINIMQYTGLKDKNGKEIYEGDIVRFQSMILVNKDGSPHYFMCEVIFEGCEFKLIKRKGNSFFGKYLKLESSDEVIGNIYENPELLEDKK